MKFLLTFLFSIRLIAATSLSVTYDSATKQVAPSGLIFSNIFTGTPTVSSNAVNKTSLDTAVAGASRQQTNYVFDDFDRADSTLNGLVAPTGQTWSVGGAGYLTAGVTNRQFTATGNVYAYLDYGKAIPRISGTFSFSRGTGTDDRTTSILTLIADAQNQGLATMIHLIVSPTTWTLQKRLSGGTVTAILSGYHDLISDVPYNIAYEIVGNTVTVYPPQGVPASVTDTDIGTINARYGCWQIRPDANGLVGKWMRVAMGPEQQGRVAAANQAAAAPDVGWLRGADGTRVQRVVSTLPGTGWYRIATVSSFFTLLNMGHVKLSVVDPYRAQLWEFDASTIYSGSPTPTLRQTYGYAYAGGSITQARLSADAGALTSGLDVYVANAQTNTLTAEFVGFFTPVSIPIVGATALPTASTTLAFSSSGNGTAGALSTPRTINGVSFDGTANITVPAAASTLTGLGTGVATSIAASQGVRAPAFGSSDTLGTFMYDDFATSNTPINGRTTPTGQTWTTGGLGYLSAGITNRTLSSGTNVYAYLDYGSAISRISGTFLYSSGAGTDDRSISTLTLIADQSNGGLSTMLHLTISPTTWFLSKFISGSQTTIATGIHDLISNVPYNAAYEISGTNITIYPPQGVPVSITDPSLPTIAARYGAWQINPAGNALVGKWMSVSMGPNQQGRTASASRAAPSGEIGWLHGSEGTRVQRLTATLSGGAGWYRIATTGQQRTFVALGHVRVSAQDAYQNNVWEFDASAIYNGTPFLRQTYGFGSSTPISSARLSTLSSGSPWTALDIYVGNVYPVTISVDFVGYFTPVSNPTVGATALATASTTLAYVGNGDGSAANLSAGGTIGSNGTAITRVRHGRASAMVAGVIAVADAYVTANTRIMLSVYTTGGTVGFLNTGTRTASTSFTITSSSVLDTSVVDWVAFEP